MSHSDEREREREDTDGGTPSTLRRDVGAPQLCPPGSVASYLIYADVRLNIPMTHCYDRYDGVCAVPASPSGYNRSFQTLDWEQVVVSRMGIALNNTGRQIWYYETSHKRCPVSSSQLEGTEAGCTPPRKILGGTTHNTSVLSVEVTRCFFTPVYADVRCYINAAVTFSPGTSTVRRTRGTEQESRTGSQT